MGTNYREVDALKKGTKATYFSMVPGGETSGRGRMGRVGLTIIKIRENNDMPK